MRFIFGPIKNQVLRIYLPLKCIAVIAIYLLMPYVAQRPLLEYLDLSNADGEYGLCLNASANQLYAFFMCAIGSKSLNSFGLIVSSIVLSTLRDILFIRVFHKYIEGRYLTFFVILLATHPYLAYAHTRFTTDLFASLGCYTYFYTCIMRRK